MSKPKPTKPDLSKQTLALFRTIFPDVQGGTTLPLDALITHLQEVHRQRGNVAVLVVDHGVLEPSASDGDPLAVKTLQMYMLTFGEPPRRGPMSGGNAPVSETTMVNGEGL